MHRRTLIALLAASAALPIAARAAPGFAITVIAMADLHSAYDRTGPLLAEIAAQAAGPHPLIVLNGDLFETGNSVTTASKGEIDWAFLAELPKLAPTVINIGNHEPDLDPDLAQFVTRATDLGITVISNIIDARSGQPYAPASITLTIADQPVTLTGIATDALFTYPESTRALIEVPPPVEWVRDHLPGLMGDGLNIVLSHAGVLADRDILPLLPDGTVLIGGHDHLTLLAEQGATRYLHTGSWSAQIAVATLIPGQPARITRIDIDPGATPHPALAALIPTTLNAHLTPDDRQIVATSPKAMPVRDLALFTAAAMARDAGGDVGFIGHTTFGAGLPAGPVSRHDFHSAIRFDGKLMQAKVTADVLADILTRINQFGDYPLHRRTGDFLYAAPDTPAKDSYLLITNGWSVMNAASYFGRDDLTFTEVPGGEVRAAVLSALGAP
ncbi:MAG: bifunctional metallophosphatase/5'-nucleotidase [Paracoccus sp. (in: a-proteobacteria)]|uniref:metallophosphoesterase n=1 Tax=Paracoccus sp. TaxID=267 RepID=UPI0026DEEEC5|nr:metallophosphoesterase [Paracoccus sp. (in: a-proteobacteria)]MDO5630684.1 bifunctional metallophosphatase/5'-nucleotidase [Paracoccus sp. (in: a-proteobacteria)]